MTGTQVALTREPRKGSNERLVGSSGSSQQRYLNRPLFYHANK